MTTRGLVWRSLRMLRAVRGLIFVSLLLGVVASALPYVSAASFGPLAQVVADAGQSGNLGSVWGWSTSANASMTTSNRCRWISSPVHAPAS